MSQPKSMRFKVLLAVGAALLCILLLGGIKGCQIYRAMSNRFMPPPDAVTTVIAAAETWEQSINAVGSIVATQGIVMSAEEAGKVSKINFESGAKVTAGSVLVELDTTVEEANLQAAVALWEQGKKSLDRARSLRAKNANSQADLDGALANERSTFGAAESLRATITRKRIVAPFAGRTGIRSVNLGEYLNPGDQVVPLFALESVYLNFTLPQQTVSKMHVGDVVRAVVDAFPGEVFEGRLSSINPQVDPVTRNIELQATIANADERLRPGMFAQATLVLPESESVITIPTSSVVYAPYGNAIYVVEKMKGPDGTEYLGSRQQIVKLGRKRGDRVAVLTGLKSGEEVVSSGGFKLRPNGAVLVNNVVTPSNSIEPKPANT